MSNKAIQLLQKMLNVVDSGHAPSRAELAPSVDLVDDYYDTLLDILDEARPIVAASALGSSKSEKKAAAVRENGKKGGRPRKEAE